MAFNIVFGLLMGVALLMSGCQSSPGENKLVHSASPYLQQHADDLVWWHPWGKDAIEQAVSENKLLFVSIGYSTCYWCKFMETDSFKKRDVARLLNKHYVSILVDREERPDVDAYFMKQLISHKGHGGWPVNIIMTPDLVPVMLSSTLKRSELKSALKKIVAQESVVPLRIPDHSVALQMPEITPVEWHAMKRSFLSQFDDALLRNADWQFGGLGKAQKFPQPHIIKAALLRYRMTQNEDIKRWVIKTLNAISTQSLYDSDNGGFRRYATDRQWQTPHYEKMMVDNLGLIEVYFDAAIALNQTLYRDVALSTLSWIQTTMTSDQGGVYTAVRHDIVDRKEIVGWNAWMVRCLLRAYEETGNQDLMVQAQSLMTQLIQPWEENQTLPRYRINDQWEGEGNLYDYAWMIVALNHLAMLQNGSLSEFLPGEWKRWSMELSHYVQQHFYNQSTGLYYLNKVSGAPLITSVLQVEDEAMQSPLSVILSGISDNTQSLKVVLSSYGQRSWVSLSGLVPLIVSDKKT